MSVELTGIGLVGLQKCILAVDSLAIQSSLTILENRYRELREIGEKRFESWQKEKGEAQQALKELHNQFEAQRVELEKVAIERDARAKESCEAQQSVEELKKQLELMAVELQKTQALLSRKETEAKSASEEVELTLLQLHQAQDELERYFLLSRRQAEVLASSQVLVARITNLGLKLIQ